MREVNWGEEDHRLDAVVEGGSSSLGSGSFLSE